MNPRTIVFIHGMFMTPLRSEHWTTHFQAKGDKMSFTGMLQ